MLGDPIQGTRSDGMTALRGGKNRKENRLQGPPPSRKGGEEEVPTPQVCSARCSKVCWQCRSARISFCRSASRRVRHCGQRAGREGQAEEGRLSFTSRYTQPG